MAKINLNDRFGRLVIEQVGRLVGRNRYFVCRCDCGNKKEIAGASLSRGATKSCGCLNAEMASARKKTHGLSNSQEYTVWCGMRQRCEDPNVSAYKNYGGRGIKVCERWLDFANFIADMGQSEGGTIERRNNDKGYSPENCYWASRKQQANNRRSNQVFLYAGKSLNIKQWSDKTGIPYFTLRSRLVILKWPTKRALTEAIRRKK